jgi:hypothetical protein
VGEKSPAEYVGMMHKKQKAILAILVGFSLIGLWSSASYLYEKTRKSLERMQKQQISASRLFLSMADYSADAEITIRNLDDALAKRDALRTYIFGVFPSGVAAVEKLGNGDFPEELQIPAHAAYKMTIPLAHGFGAEAYVLVPSQNSGHAVIMHQGHGGPWSLTMEKEGRDIRDLLHKGFVVALYKMPLFGAGTPAYLEIGGARFLRHSLSHDMLPYLHFESGSFHRLFLEPVIVGINTLESYFHVKTIRMIGLSGGGWTTTVAAAIDPRITVSISAAGSYPLAFRLLREFRHNRGDAEQMDPLLLKIAGYLDLYILGSLEKGRKHLQILNEQDPCCFNGDLWQLYEASVMQRLSDLSGGTFQVFCDRLEKVHKISDKAYSEIYDLFEGKR